MQYLLGKAAVLQTTFKDLLTDLPADPPGVTFTMVDPQGVVTTATYAGPGTGTFSGASGLSRLSPGTFQFVAVPTYAGSPWRWSFLSTSTATPTEYASSFGVISTAAYPFPYGYCFAGETLVTTPGGPQRIDRLAEAGMASVMTAPVPGELHDRPRWRNSAAFRHGHWVDAEIRSFGVQPLLSVALRRSHETKVIRATPEHLWLTTQAGNHHYIRSLRTSDLESGMSLAALLPQPLTTRSTPSPVGVMAGLVFGDGTRDGSMGASIDLWGQKNLALLPYFAGHSTRPVTTPNGVDGVRVRGLPASWKRLPSLDEGIPFLLGWLAGYLAADGSVSPDGSIRLYSARPEHLEWAAIVAQRLGIATYSIRFETRRGLGTESTPIYRMGFVASTMLGDLLIRPDHRARFPDVEHGSRGVRWTIEDIRDEGDSEEVFCAIVPETHTFTLDGNIWVHNCDMTDVQSRIQAGSWTPTKTGAWPTMQQAQDFILQGAVAIDTVLARTGYTIPLVPQSGKVIGQQVWQTLLDINAALAVAHVEKARHGSQDLNEDTNATWWMTYGDDRLARIESGDDNLSLFGLDGPFYPIADKSKGMAFLGTTDAAGNAVAPFFTRGMTVV